MAEWLIASRWKREGRINSLHEFESRFLLHRHRQNMYVDVLLSTLIKQTRKQSPPFRGQWAPHTWLEEHRTVTLGLPRRTGKTTALVNLAKSKPSLLFGMNYIGARAQSRTHGVEFHTSELFHRGHSLVMQHPAELVLLDEWLGALPETKANFYDFLTRLFARRQLTEDVVIVNVGT